MTREMISNSSELRVTGRRSWESWSISRSARWREGFSFSCRKRQREMRAAKLKLHSYRTTEM
eukprot:scaffold20908_cov94-Skeletonema_dohrnii-CCMP3373.AAC.1